MFHHRSCGTANLVALMAAHRALRDAPGGLRQQDVARLTARLQTAPPGPPSAPPSPARPPSVPRQN
ncbi:hypothetical protein [Roseomonas sp. USHLN139]|uniref:hypothetical protein n=1 Tax=Roseomonas sp. USHLN139 TaxID=3081298 RepID=UPI003B02DF95